MTILTVHSYSWHYLMIIMAFLCHAQLRSRANEEIGRGLFLKASLLFLSCAAIAQLINYYLHPYGELNMFYISLWEPIRQAVFSDIAGQIGDLLTHLLYLVFIIIGARMVDKGCKGRRNQQNVISGS